MQYVKDNNRRNPKKLLDLAREILRRKHCSIRTEVAYVGWIARCIYFYDKRHPQKCGCTRDRDTSLEYTGCPAKILNILF